jgi:hypothetical protein
MKMKKDELELWKSVMMVALESEHMLPERWPEKMERTEYAALLACDIADKVIERYIEAKNYDW